MINIPDSFIKQIEYTITRLHLSVPENVWAALATVPRELFLERRYRGDAYRNHPIPIPRGQTCSAPDIYAIMMSEEYLNASDGMRILEVGTGSGYGAALLGYSYQSGNIVSVERIQELVVFARNNIEQFRQYLQSIGDLYQPDNISVIHSDGTGRMNVGLFDRIIVTACGPHVPVELFSKLSEGGVMIIPLETNSGQSLYRVKRVGDKMIKQRMIDVRFVRLIGEDGY